MHYSTYTIKQLLWWQKLRGCQSTFGTVYCLAARTQYHTWTFWDITENVYIWGHRTLWLFDTEHLRKILYLLTYLWCGTL